ncbi:hypothetical protein Adt_39612 [Abeliophyllum distichum]|uniref:Uncharacterized protein n=1 Tax=Abeliophyllum distichum TaxID=126358 RepID=A0ABD1Q9T8_9LAMI
MSLEVSQLYFRSKRICGYVERVGHSSLSEKFSNGTSIMDIDDRHFDDLDLDDETDKHLSKVLMVLVRLLSSPVMILQKGEAVIGGMHLSSLGRSHLSSRHFGQVRSLQLKVVKSF